MPSLASVFVVRTADLPALVAAVTAAGPPGAVEAIRAYGRELDDAYFWSGHDLLFVVQHLWRSRGVSLFSVLHQQEESRLSDDSGGTVIILGAEHKPLLPKLEQALADPRELLTGLTAWGVAPAEAALAVPDALILLRDQITHLTDDRLILIHVE